MKSSRCSTAASSASPKNSTPEEFAGPALLVGLTDHHSWGASILDLDQDGAGELVLQETRADVDQLNQGQAWILENFLLPGDHPEIW